MQLCSRLSCAVNVEIKSSDVALHRANGVIFSFLFPRGSELGGEFFLTKNMSSDEQDKIVTFPLEKKMFFVL